MISSLALAVKDNALSSEGCQSSEYQFSLKQQEPRIVKLKAEGLGAIAMTEMKSSSPPITHLKWGQIEVEGQRYKDAKLFPGGAREWDWRETGTQHRPGIQPADISELLEKGAQVLILSQGMWKRLEVSPQTLEMLKEKGIEVHILQTQLAAKLYNQLRETTTVGGLFHSTC